MAAKKKSESEGQVYVHSDFDHERTITSPVAQVQAVYNGWRLKGAEQAQVPTQAEVKKAIEDTPASEVVAPATES